MKSRKRFLILSALVAVCLSSCSNDEDVNVNDGAVCFTAGIGKEAVATPQSRAAGTQWGAGDKIGIFMVYSRTDDIADNASNKEYTTANGAGIFTPIIGNEINYPVDGSQVDFIAYYPHAENAPLGAPLSVQVATTQTATSQAGCDLMWAKANNGGPGYDKYDTDAVELTFGHCLSKLTMNCKLDKSVGVSTLDGATVTIKGMNTRNTFDLKNAALSSMPDTPQDIVPNKLSVATTGFLATYDAIIQPGSYAAGAVTVEFEVNSETYT